MSQAERALERGTHYIEESVWVYLMRDWDGTDRWVLDPVTVDGCGLDSVSRAVRSCSDRSWILMGRRACGVRVRGR